MIYAQSSKSHVNSQCRLISFMQRSIPTPVLNSKFLNQVHANWFLEIAFVHDIGMCMCVRVCVRPQGYKLHLRDIQPVQPAEQVCCTLKHNGAFYAWAWPLQ